MDISQLRVVRAIRVLSFAAEFISTTESRAQRLSLSQTNHSNRKNSQRNTFFSS
ncbi:MAG: hypothetical protein QNJ34_15210 [Xenococcaceae cyanobacterium MO_188.B29]|nr:hypothetical protein [Xenococcaceae cyanobacterium MO_188.B29]